MRTHAVEAVERRLPVRPIEVEEFEKMLAASVFPEGERLELLRGKIVRLSPHSDEHVIGILRAEKFLHRVFRKGFHVRQQLPLAFPSVRSRPEPDLAVVAVGAKPTWSVPVPASALLVIEVALSTLEIDRSIKAPIYASGAVMDYWIVNLVDRVLEVHRDPTQSDEGMLYETVAVLEPRAQIAPLAAPRRKVRVKDLLP